MTPPFKRGDVIVVNDNYTALSKGDRYTVERCYVIGLNDWRVNLVELYGTYYTWRFDLAQASCIFKEPP